MTERTQPSVPNLSIIIPVHNGGATLRACLEALLSAPGPTRELIVVDDGSQDDSASIAAALGVRTVQNPVNLGCGSARNSGAKFAAAPILVFVDADVIIERGALQRISKSMIENSDYSALFGSYDSEPHDPGLVSQYRNLLHHFTHQHGNCEAETFWTGLGAIRRPVFEEMGGFQAEYDPIADIKLGVDLFKAAHRIRLDKGLLGKHLKAWTLRTMVTTDLLFRALPWTEIILKRGRFSNDLNTSFRNRIGVACTPLILIFLAMAALSPVFFAWTAFFCLAFLLANANLLRQFWKARGMLFALRIVPLHFLHQLCSGLGFILGLMRHYLHLRPNVPLLRFTHVDSTQPCSGKTARGRSPKALTSDQRDSTAL